MFEWEDKPELNITPLVDVMLVLLAILMVISPNIVYEELINLPKGSAQVEVSEKKQVEIFINAKEEIKINNQRFKIENFEKAFRSIISNVDQKSVIRISADQSLRYGVIMSVMSTVKNAGYANISLATH